ncbi:hypothetical protein C8258_16780 [Nocardia sp. MDA0666]|uniref:type VII secretion target n=1 Tax=Nocardia sp. MDA0666 TaxID=2135448 RepID=UPI000D12232F|nr:type VII secretion target [Nocardia sp. MDA0666]PSR67268.1 hypothetical protein C8258_16780 [Nocardia sp. MDA0666]
MANFLDLDPDQLRRYAEQLDRYAAAMRKWGEIPKDWLDEFPNGYGTIADPLHGALEDYYRNRHDKAEAQAASAERTARDLRAAADRMENSELSGGQQIANTGPHSGPSPVTHGPGSAKDAPDRAAPHIPGAAPQRLPDDNHTPFTDTVHPSPAASTPELGHDGGVAPSEPHIGASVGISHPAPGPEHDTDASMPPIGHRHAEGHVMPIGVDPSATGYGGGELSAEPVAAAAPPIAPAGPGPAGPVPAGPPPRPPMPLRAGPFEVSAFPARGRRQGLTPLVVGNTDEDDLTLARTLLSAVLYAVGDTAPDVEWATGVVRNSRGVVVLLTSTEGRGWLPPGLFVPSEVLVPWQWDSILNTEGRAAMAMFEGCPDPAVILTEFARHASGNKRGQLRALASSAVVDDYVRATLGDTVAVTDRVMANETAVDLSRPGAGLADRLDVGGSPASRQLATTIPDSEIRATCLRLAHAADELVRQAVTGTAPESAARRIRRRDALKSVRTGQEARIVSPEHSPTAQQYGVAPSTTVFAPIAPSHQAVASPVGTSVRRSSSDTDIERGRTLERRADEVLSLLLAGGDDRQVLRDVLYAHDQIAAHPQLENMMRTTGSGYVDSVPTGPGAITRPSDEYSSFPVSPGLDAAAVDRSIR